MLSFTLGIRFADHLFIYRRLRHTVTTVNRYLPFAGEPVNENQLFSGPVA